MERLLTPFYEVMYKYQKHFSERGVRANINRWLERKAPLITLLRRHPNWDETALAVVFEITESREIDRQVVERKKQRLIQMAGQGISTPQTQTFINALNTAVDGYSVSLSENAAERIKGMCEVKCVAGQKTSRVINRLCQQYHVDRHADYNSVFAQLSDALSPGTVSKKALLSLHPCDYLEMSSTASSWTSCHNLDHGAYQAGCLSYMTDEVSMVFYTVDSGVTGEYHKAPRRNRQMYCYHEGLLLQSRLYPNDGNADIQTLYRNLVQTAIALCLESPNRWLLKKKRDDTQQYLHTVEGSKHYTDYDSFGTLSMLKTMEPGQRLDIGSRPVCVCCGNTLTGSGNLKCNCEDQVVCMDCGTTVNARHARYHEGAWLCNSCLRICAHCGAAVHEDLIPAFDGRGSIIRICRDCHETALAPCAGCGVRTVCSMIQGSRFCRRSAGALTAPAAVAIPQAA
jgi:hypothetical protein